MRISTILLLAALAGCAAPGAGRPAAEGPGTATGVATATARLGETVRLGGVRVRPVAVLEDSRCPEGVTCIWAGRLRLRAAVSGVPDGEVELVLGAPYALPGGGTLTLAGAPRPAARFTFRRD